MAQPHPHSLSLTLSLAPPNMAAVIPEYPLDFDGVCMVCKETPAAEGATLRCTTCTTPWHMACLSEVNSAEAFKCPDCSGAGLGGAPKPINSEKQEVSDTIPDQIEADLCFSELGTAEESFEVNEYNSSDDFPSFMCLYCKEVWNLL